MKYTEIVQNDYSDKVGTVKIDGHDVQLCDHIQIVDGRYHVSALFTDDNETGPLNAMGAKTKKMYNGTKVAYLNEEMLTHATPVYQDGMTEQLIDRLIKAMRSLNAQRVAA